MKVVFYGEEFELSEMDTVLLKEFVEEAEMIDEVSEDVIEMKKELKRRGELK